MAEKFNKLCEKILIVAGEKTVCSVGVRVAVAELAERFDPDRTDARNALQYLADLDLISIETIVGPLF